MLSSTPEIRVFDPARRLHVEVESIRTISHSVAYSCAWPSLIRRRDGVLTLVYSGGRDGHICPFGRVEMMVSHDDGATWSWPRVILDTDIDDRDAGVVETSTGALLVSTFSHVQYEYIITSVEAGKRVPFVAEGQVRDDLLNPERLPAWRSARDRVSAQERQRQAGAWMIRSTDEGRSWSSHDRCQVNSPHGPTLLRDGTLLFVGKQMEDANGRIGACSSQDEGKSWNWIGEIPSEPCHAVVEFHEPHAVQAADGAIIAQIRNHNTSNKYEILQSRSLDGGKSWSRPRSTGVWGFPSHLLRLRDDRILMTYGHRRKPFGNCVRISKDHGETWSDEMFLYSGGQSADLGYPSTAELADGSFISVWYEALGLSSTTVLRQARWRLI